MALKDGELEEEGHLERPKKTMMDPPRAETFRGGCRTCAGGFEAKRGSETMRAHQERSFGSFRTLYAFWSSWNACVAASVLPFLSGWRCIARSLYLPTDLQFVLQVSRFCNALFLQRVGIDVARHTQHLVVTAPARAAAGHVWLWFQLPLSLGH